MFHNFLMKNLDKYFPEKTTKMSTLVRNWFSPQLKQLNRALKREFYSHRKSKKYKKLKSKFEKLKKSTIRTFYSGFVTDLKSINPGKWYNMAKKIGVVDQMTGGDIQVESLTYYNNPECDQKIVQHFAAISKEYKPVNNLQLPCYLPALPAPAG